MKASRRRPVIGVTGPDRGGLFQWLFTALSVWRAGGRPMRLTPKRYRGSEAIAGLIIGGGSDVDPTLYGETLVKKIQRERESFRKAFWQLVFGVMFYLARKLFATKRVSRGLDQARDRLELALIDHALREKLPLLGICRGAQLINVYFGGSLNQDIRDFYTETPQIRSVFPKKRVSIKPGTCLASILGKAECRVNSLHNQSMKDLGRGLRVTAHESNGVVQAIETSGDSFVLGVQWHPEFLQHHGEQQAIFAELVHKAQLTGRTAEPLPLSRLVSRPFTDPGLAPPS